MAQVKYPIGIQSFSSIREGGYLYVDKTGYIADLLNSASKFVFLSRPRRFGKSLLLSTIKEYFLGRQDMFEGLEISRREHDWVKHPVFHLDFTGANYNDPVGLTSKLNSRLTSWEKECGIEKEDGDFGVRFETIIKQAYEKTGQKVVILIDEYDKALLETVDKPELQQKYRDTLRGVYGNLKQMDKYIRFAMLTGVTRFGHLSIFSDLNNLNDISMRGEYAGICGITGEELHASFSSGVKAFSEKLGVSENEVYEELRINYDGYHFAPENLVDVYNPFSVLNALSARFFGQYWFQTGTPTFLIKMLKARQLSLRTLSEYECEIDDLTDVSFDLGNFIPVMYQSGYLTIKKYNSRFQSVTLGFPNREVERAFLRQLLPYYTSLSSQKTAFEIKRFVLDVEEGLTEDFMVRLQSLFADFQYDSFELRHLEQHYQDVIFIIFKLMGFYTRTEYKTASGRIDMVVKTPDYIYVMEFKMDRSAEEALAQIDTKDYLLPFKADGRKLIKIGANFDSTKRTLASWIIQEN